MDELCVHWTDFCEISYRRPGVDLGFVGPKINTIFGALFKKNNRKLQIEN
jgi:hypothetical protein